MTEQEAYQEHIRYTHDTYCRIVIRHASFDAARMLAAGDKIRKLHSDRLDYAVFSKSLVHNKGKRKRDESPASLFQVLDVQRM